MNREIKFRAKMATSDTWIYGHYAFVDGYHVIYEDGNPHVIKLNTLGQYTGLKDKNGVEIYEGDVIEYTMLKFNGVGYVDEEYIGVVGYGDAVFEIDRVPLYVAHSEDDEIEVIGNVLEDGDLLDS